MPAPTFDQEAGSTTLTPTFAANPPAGATVILFFQHTTGTVSLVSGCGAQWGQAVSGGAGGVDVWVGKGCTGAAKVVTISCPGAGTTTAKIVSFAGAEAVPSTPLTGIDVQNSTNTQGSPFTTAGVALTPVYVNTAILALMYVQESSVNVTVSSAGGFTALTDQSGAGTEVIAAGYLAPATAGVSSATVWSVPNAATPTVYIVSIKGAGAAATSGTFASAGASSFSAEAANVPIPPGASMPIEIRVYAAANPNGPVIGVLPGFRNLRFHAPLNDIGAGALELALSDPGATSAITTQYNLVRVFMGAWDVFQFWLDTPVYVLASPDGPAGEKVTLAGRGLEAYLERGVIVVDMTFATVTVGYYMDACIKAIRASYGALSLLKWDFSNLIDSAGVAWADASAYISLNVAAGTSLLALVNTLRGVGLIVRLRRDFTLQVFQAYGKDVTGSVVLRKGGAIAGAVTYARAAAGAANIMLARTKAGTTVVLEDYTVPMPDVFMGYVQGGDAADLYFLGLQAKAEIAARHAAATPIQVPIFHGQDAGQVEPYRNFDVGDKVALDIPGPVVPATSQLVVAITVTASDANGYAVVLDLSSPQPDIQLASIREIAAVGAPTT